MRFVFFYHSLVSDWNHGNAHFLRGVVRELVDRGHGVEVYEPSNGWSLSNLLRDHGTAPLEELAARYPELRSSTYEPEAIDLDRALDGVDLVVVHEWTDPDLVARLGGHRRRTRGHRLLFHDTHHRAVTQPEEMAGLDLSGYDGVLAFGEVLRRIYLERGWAERAWTWHEAADTRLFRPLDAPKAGDVVWIGNWGDDERTAELEEFLLEPARALAAKTAVYGVRYPPEALEALAARGIAYGGWLPNHRVPEVFARFRATVHVPRRPYVEALVGVPTIRPFEALACGIPLVSAPWEDAERLFRPGRDFLMARDGREMTARLRDVLEDGELAASLAASGLETIRARHTCAHRVDELLEIARSLGAADTDQ